MIISEDVKKTLVMTDGHMFRFSISTSREGKDRKRQVIDVLKELNADNIIHIGCCGHLANIKRQLDNGTWFHDMLCEHFANVIGTDINEEAVNYLLSMDKRRIYAKDAITDSVDLIKELNGENKMGGGDNAIILPEVLEHIENPILFLAKLKECYEGAYIVITVPNAFGTWVIKDVIRHNYEVINSDHKYWFTPYTLLKQMTMAGISIIDLQFCDWSIMTKLFKRPMMCNTLLAVGKL